ncbi:MAG: SusC/RagA family TonB-linked outer membrane protein [Bacteroidetes bacterium]|nr:SusC/RagA family TonB-linked outer membrane protein [Bacteroidota bacterium]
MRVKSLLLCLMVLLFTYAGYAQSTITGTISDANGKPLIGATVGAVGTTTGASSNVNGKYSISVPASVDSLKFSYTGMETQTVAINGRSVIDVTLSAGEFQLDNVVVTALGISREAKAVGSAVQEVSGEDLTISGATGFIDGISGKAAGLQVTRSSGAAGSASRIVLRGQTSFNGDNEALLVVDGVRFNNEESHTERSLAGVAVSNRGLDINPDDIESVTVLKGAAATALYGVEGARGVIVITTKKGSQQGSKKMSVNYNTSYTITQPSLMIDMQNKYSQGTGGAWYGPGQGDGIWWGGFSSAMSWGAPIDQLSWNGNSEYTWDKNGEIVLSSDPSAKTKVTPYDNVGDFFQNGRGITHNVSISGGQGNTTYRFSLSDTREQGIVPLNTYKRTNVGLKMRSSFLNDKINMSASVNYINSGGRRIQQGSNTSGIMLGLLRTPPTFDNANGLEEPWNADDPSAYMFADGRQRSYRAGGGYDNPYWVINNSPFVDNVNRMFGTIQLEYPMHQWFNLAANIGTDVYTDNRKQEFEIGSNTVRAGQVREDNYNYSHTDAYLTATGRSDESKNWVFGYMLGANFWNKTLQQNYLQGDGLNFVGFRNITNTQNLSGYIDNSNERSFALFGNLDLSYKRFLYLNATARQDYLSSLIVPTKEFNAGDISFFAPSVSASFIFSELMDMEALSFGKLRASFGQVGGGAPSSYSTSTTFLMPVHNAGTVNDLNDGWTNGIGFPYQGLAGFTYNAVQGSDGLVPSVTTDIELGADLRFFNGRLTLDASYYTRTSDRQIIAINVPNSTGFQRKVINSGTLETNGGEIVLGYTPIKTKDFEWTLTANFAKWRTWVEKLPEGVQNQYLDGFTGTQVSNIAPEKDENGNVTKRYQYGQLFGGAWQRANTEDGKSFDPALPYNPDGALIIDDSGSPDPNDTIVGYNDNYGYPLVDPINRVIGNPNPDYLLGISSSLRYKNVKLDFLFDIKQGGQMWNGTMGALTFFGTSANTEDRDAIIWNDNVGFAHDYDKASHLYEGVKASDGSTNDIKVALDENWYSGNGGGFGSVAEHFIQDASYYRLRYVTLSYDMTNVIKSNTFGKISASFTGRNLLILTPYQGIDPESSLVGSASNGQGLDYFQMPGVKSYQFSLNLTF